MTQPTIAFCYFVSMTGGTKATVKTQSEKPYAYLNNLGLKEGDQAVVPRDGKFGIVEIARNVPLNTRKAAEKITQPLIAPVELSVTRIREDYKSITGAKDMIEESRRQSKIDEVLGIDRSEETGSPALTDGSAND